MVTAETAFIPGTANWGVKPVPEALLESQVLPKIFKPGRYMGAEQGAYRKPFDQATATMLLGFPDVYEIGASSYAIKLLYSVVNQHPDFMCDRTYAAAQDMREQLREQGIPLFGVESKRPMRAFDLLAVSLQYELNYTTVLGLLEAGQLPLRSAQRAEAEAASGVAMPIVLGGGPGATNPNPLLPFLDGFMIGDGEDLLLEVLAVLAEAREKGWSRQQKLEALARVEGVYIPGVNDYARKRIVDISQREIKIAPLIPAVEAVHDRVVVEARRGCDRMCRFCQPAFINLPARENDVEKIKKEALQQLAETGYEECSLLSLSIADYSQFKHLVGEVAGAMKENKASLSLSSQRADRFSLEVAEAVQSVRKSTLTFAPEAGTPRLRDVINKNLTDGDILNAVTTAYQAGWNKVKLYYMIGLPTETQTDLDGIVAMLQKMKTACEQIKRVPGKSIKRHLEINVTLSNFVPKPHTPFQWHAQDSIASLNEKIAYLRERFKKLKGVKANFTSPEISKLEAVISRGGPELADALELAYKNGAYLDAWDETRPFSKWFEALEAIGINVEAYTQERFTQPDEPLPWDGIDVGLDKQWLKTEWERSLRAASTTPCFEACSLCGVCSEFSIWPTFTNQGAGIASTNAATLEDKQEAEATAAYQPSELALNTEGLESPESQILPFKPHASAHNPSAPPAQRIRLLIQKKGGLRYMSHLDWLRMLQRVIRKTGLPVAYTQGFNPSPKLGFGPALPLFCQSEGEWVDMDVIEPLPDIENGGLVARLNAALPEDGQVLRAWEIPLTSKSIDLSLTAMDYIVQWTCTDPVSNSMIETKVKGLLACPSIPVTVSSKKGEPRTIDIRPYLASVSLTGQQHQFLFQVHRYPGQPEAQHPTWIKPDWLLHWLAPEASWSVTRLALSSQPLERNSHEAVAVAS